MINKKNIKYPSVQFLVSTKNSSQTIENLLYSLSKIKYNNFSVLFADGNSKDDTLNKILKYKSKFDFDLVSKKDKGIYHAWNKLIKYSESEWICFIGSDDIVIPKEIDEFLFYRLPIINKTELNLISCTSKLVKNNNKDFFGKSYYKLDPYKNMTIANCSTFYRRNLITNKEFFEELRICGDYEFLLSVKDNIRHGFSSICITEMGGYGLSNKKYNQVLFETLAALNKNNCPKIKMISYIIRFYGSILKNFLNEVINLRSR